MITFAIGDIHGQSAKLKSLLSYCEDYRSGRVALFVFLGDYINRGPDSKGVVQTLIDRQLSRGDVICLRGNHEAALGELIGGHIPLYRFLLMGGDATLASYGVRSVAEIPEPHVRWLLNRPIRYDDALRLFVHAGIDPQRQLTDQNDADLLWIREPFLSDSREFDHLVVHGHTPLHKHLPEVKSNRVNIDTAAAYGGPITAAVFSDRSAYPLAFINSEGRRFSIKSPGN